MAFAPRSSSPLKTGSSSSMRGPVLGKSSSKTLDRLASPRSPRSPVERPKMTRKESTKVITEFKTPLTRLKWDPFDVLKAWLFLKPSTHDAFRVFDSRKSGKVSATEFRRALQYIDLDFDKTEINAILDKVRLKERSDILTFTDFTNAFSLSEQSAKSKEDFLNIEAPSTVDDLLRRVHFFIFQKRVRMQEAFRLFDTSRSKYIGIKAWKEGLGRMQLGTVSEEIAKAAFEKIDMGGNGYITFPDFAEIFSVSMKDVSSEDTDELVSMIRAKIHDSGESIQEAFMTFDKSGDGQISIFEFATGLERLGIFLSPKQCKALMTMADTSFDANISYSEWMATFDGKRFRERVGSLRIDQMKRQFHSLMAGRGISLPEMFRQLDDNNNGIVSLAEFRKGLDKLRLQIPPQEFEQLVRQADKSNDGMVDYKEFLAEFDTDNVVYAPPYESCLFFDGKRSHVNCVSNGNGLQLGVEKAITVEAWIYRDGYQSGYVVSCGPDPHDDRERLRYKRLRWTVDGGFSLFVNKDKTTFRLQRTSHKKIEISVQSSATDKVPSWQHVACTWEEKTKRVRMYINGNLRQVGDFSGPLGGKMTHFMVGKAPVTSGWEAEPVHIMNSPNGLFHGTLSDVRVWNVARSEDEIFESMRHKLKGGEEGLVLHYPLREGFGFVVEDNTPFQNHGHLVSMHPEISWQMSGDPEETEPITSIQVIAFDSPPPPGYVKVNSRFDVVARTPMVGQKTICYRKGRGLRCPKRILPKPTGPSIFGSAKSDESDIQYCKGIFDAAEDPFMNVAIDLRVMYDHEVLAQFDETYSQPLDNGAGVQRYHRLNNTIIAWKEVPVVGTARVQNSDEVPYLTDLSLAPQIQVPLSGQTLICSQIPELEAYLCYKFRKGEEPPPTVDNRSPSLLFTPLEYSGYLDAIYEQFVLKFDSAYLSFRELDRDMDGVASFQDFQETMSNLEFEFPTALALDLFRRLDTDKDLVVSFHEWTAFWESKENQTAPGGLPRVITRKREVEKGVTCHRPPSNMSTYMGLIQIYNDLEDSTTSDEGDKRSWTVEAWVNIEAGRWASDERSPSLDFLTDVFEVKLFERRGREWSLTAENNGVKPIIKSCWHHYAITWQETTGILQLYIDGSPFTQLRVMDASKWSRMIIGDDRGGFISDLRLWKCKRSQAEIQASIYRVLSGNESGLAVYARNGEDIAITYPELLEISALPCPSQVESAETETLSSEALVVRVCEAKGLQSLAGGNIKPNPQAAVTWGASRQTTRVIRQATHPVYDHLFFFGTGESAATVCYVDLFDGGIQDNEHLLGRAQVDLLALEDRSWNKRTLELKDRKGKPIDGAEIVCQFFPNIVETVGVSVGQEKAALSAADKLIQGRPYAMSDPNRRDRANSAPMSPRGRASSLANRTLYRKESVSLKDTAVDVFLSGRRTGKSKFKRAASAVLDGGSYFSRLSVLSQKKPEQEETGGREAAQRVAQAHRKQSEASQYQPQPIAEEDDLGISEDNEATPRGTPYSFSQHHSELPDLRDGTERARHVSIPNAPILEERSGSFTGWAEEDVEINAQQEAADARKDRAEESLPAIDMSGLGQGGDNRPVTSMSARVQPPRPESSMGPAPAEAQRPVSAAPAMVGTPKQVDRFLDVRTSPRLDTTINVKNVTKPASPLPWSPRQSPRTAKIVKLNPSERRPKQLNPQKRPVSAAEKTPRCSTPHMAQIVHSAGRQRRPVSAPVTSVEILESPRTKTRGDSYWDHLMVSAKNRYPKISYDSLRQSYLASFFASFPKESGPDPPLPLPSRFHTQKPTRTATKSPAMLSRAQRPAN